MYRPPRGNSRLFFQFLERYLLFVSENKYKVICGGAVNINMLADTPVKRELVTLLHTFCCTNVISTATRTAPNSATCIDLFITNIGTDFVKAGVLNCCLSDHMPIFLAFKGTLDRKMGFNIVLHKLSVKVD